MFKFREEQSLLLEEGGEICPRHLPRLGENTDLFVDRPGLRLASLGHHQRRTVCWGLLAKPNGQAAFGMGSVRQRWAIPR
jgi:hypothetical protein